MNYRKRIMQSVLRARKYGWRIIGGDFIRRHGKKRCCCPMTALTLGPKGEAPSESFNVLARMAASKLGVKQKCVEQFTIGFDDDRTRAQHETTLKSKLKSSASIKEYMEFFDLGVEFRRRLRVRLTW
jgi:hypothetical protein